MKDRVPDADQCLLNPPGPEYARQMGCRITIPTALPLGLTMDLP